MAGINIDRLAEYPIVSIDGETTGLHFKKDKLFGIAVAAKDGDRMYSGYYDIREKPQIVEALNAKLKYVKRIVNHNIKFDAHFFREAGINVPLDRIECTSVRAALIDETLYPDEYGLDPLCRKYIERGKAVEVYADLANIFGGKADRQTQMKNLHRAPASLAAKYATPDPELAILLWEWQDREIERQQLQKVWGLERRLTPMLIDIESEGIRVDEERAHREWKALDIRIDEAQHKLDKLIGRSVNANSPKQVQALFGVYKKVVTDGELQREVWYTDTGHALESTEAGAPSIDKMALDTLEIRGDPRANGILFLRRMIKARSFFKNHILGHAIDGRIYPNYNQIKMETGRGVGPGRLSMDTPAMQQIPARDIDVAEIVRPCILPEKGHDWACGDWEQFEFRWFGHYTNSPAIIEAYQKNPDMDYHQIVSDITGIPRNAPKAGGANAKQINLGLVFGMGEGESAYQMRLDYTSRFDKEGREWKSAGPKAAAVFAKYHEMLPEVNILKDKATSIARNRGFVRTVMGRHIRFRKGGYHKAAGLVFQGSSADCMKLKMVKLWEMSKQMGYKYRLSVHDENDLSIPKKETKHVLKEVKRELEAFGPGDEIECRIPIRCSIKTGANWWEACKKD